MRTLLRNTVLWTLSGGIICCSLMAAPASDILPLETRRRSVETAERVAKISTPAALPSDIVNVFNPVAFGQPDGDELKAISAARATTEASRPATDRELLEALIPKITPSGTLIIGGEPLLIFGKKRLRVGDVLTVSYDGQDYNLELTTIDRTTFTVRLNHEKITRQIKPGKPQ